MSAADKFVHSSMKTSCAALCQAIGWNSAQPSALDVLSDVFQRYFMDIAKKTHRYAESCGRSQPNFEDAALVFEDMNISIPELEEYVTHFDPVPFPAPNPPAFPIPRESHLNYLRPGSEEVLTRPVHVHEYMPPMITEEEKKKDKPEQQQQADIQLPAIAAPVPALEEKVDNKIEEPEKRPAPVLNGKVNGIDGKVGDGLDSESDSDDSVIRASMMSPNSPKIAKAKRLDSPGENPALKRVRMMLEEEGHPLREITSVMMTTSGYLTSSREGRLPDSKPPPNKDFFEPLAPAVVEKKKKIPTMKKIIEGVKKIDKEKENHSSKDSGDSGLNLFEKPDKIFTAPSAVVSGIAAERNTQKDGTPEKVKEPKEKSKEKKDKSEKKSEKKSSGSKEENRDKQKLKIFKKKSMKEVAKEHVAKIKPKTEPESGIEAIESDEDFGVSASSQDREVSPPKKKKNKEKLILIPPKPNKEKKLKTKPLTGSPLTVTKIAKVPKKPPEPVGIFDNPDRIVPVLIGAQKKKRGRPKKAVPPFNIMGGLHGMEAAPTTLRPMKFNRKMLSDQDDVFKSLVPEISINVKPPPPPSVMQRLPLQPGLIPAFVPPSNLKMPSPLPPSISITPATPTITPSSPAGLRDGSRNSQFSNLHTNVCSSVTITPIDMSNSQKLPTPFDSQPTPGIGSPNLSNKSSSAATIVPLQSDSGITITPIVMDNQPGQVGQVEKPASGLAKLEQNLRTKEQRKKDKEKRKELKKEKKKEKKEKLKEKLRKEDVRDKDRDKSIKKEKKDKSEKKKKKEREGSTPVEATVPKLTLKLQHSTTTTPVDSPNPPPSYHGEVDHPPPRKITIKPIEEVKPRSPSPELARFSALVTRPAKKVPVPKKSPPAVITKTPKQEVISFPDVSTTPSGGGGGSKRGRGRPPKSGKSSSHKSSTQAGLITETVGSYIDEHGNKIWICPACGRQDDGSPMIGCENCDDWYHFTCVGIDQEPDESDQWFCRKCQKTPSSDHRKKVSRL